MPLQQAENILQDLPCGCVIFTEGGDLLFANRTLCEQLGYQPEEIQGKSLEILMTISSRIFHQTHFFPLLQLKGEVSEIFLTLKCKSGNPVPVMANAKFTSGDSQSFYVCVFAPVWERQKYEEQLLEINRAQQKAQDDNAILNRLKDELESNQFELDRKISILKERSEEYLQMGKVFMHDMQEPIRKISLFLDTFSQQAGMTGIATKQNHLEVIKKSITRLRFLTSSLLDFVQISNASDPVVLVDPAALIEQARQQVVKVYETVHFRLEIGTLPAFDGRAMQVKRVFVELFKNAVENKAPERELRISVSAIVSQENAYQNNLSKYRYTDHIRIEFTDNGSGFEDRFKDYVFGLLNKLNPGSPGPGLGLALCKQIISSHYGTIQVRSLVGQGTTIIILMPLRQVPAYI